MLYDLLRTLKARGAVIVPRGDDIAVRPKEAVDGLAQELETSWKELQHLLTQWGGGPAWALLDAYLRGYKLIQTLRELQEAVEKLRASPVLSMDLETTGLDPREDQVRLITMADEVSTYVVDVKAPALYSKNIGDILKKLFDGRRRVIFHNALYDLEFLFYMGVEPAPGSIYDTGIAEQVIRHLEWMPSLKALARYYAGLNLDKTLQKSDWSGPLTDEQRLYAALDARAVYLVYKKQNEELSRLGLWRAVGIDFNAIPAVVWMRASGVPLDLQCWYRAAEKETAAMNEVLKELEKLSPGVNWNSYDQVLQVLQREGLPVKDTKEDTLIQYIDHPIVEKLLQYREHKKRLGSYGSNWDEYINKRTGRIHPSWKVIGAQTGRMACIDPNVMQVPREGNYRLCVKAPKGRVLIKADFSQIEARLAALIAGDITMLKAFRAGKDLHTLTAAMVTGKSERDVTKSDRQIAKALNFGLIFGMSAERFRVHAYSKFGVRLTLEEAKELRAAFFNTYRGIRNWHMSQVDGEVEVRTLTGRRRVTDKYTKKLNSPIQGTGADILKLALVKLYERRKELPGVYPILTVHDEIVLEAPLHLARAAKEHLVKAMLDASQEITGGGVVIDVEAGIYRDWSATEEVEV